MITFRRYRPNAMVITIAVIAAMMLFASYSKLTLVWGPASAGAQTEDLDDEANRAASRIRLEEMTQHRRRYEERRKQQAGTWAAKRFRTPGVQRQLPRAPRLPADWEALREGQ